MVNDPAANAIGAWLHGMATGVAHAATGFHNYVEGQPSLQQGVSDFVRGLVGGSDPAQARAVAADPPKAAAAKSGGNPDLGPMVTLGNGQTVRMPSAAWIKAHPPEPISAGAGTPQGAGPTPAAAGQSPADNRPANAFDFVRQAAMNNPNLTIGQLGTVADAAARLIPQKALVPKDQVIAQYGDLANRYAQKLAEDPNYAKSPVGQAHYNLIQNLRSVITPNPMFDVANMGLYNPDPTQAP